MVVVVVVVMVVIDGCGFDCGDVILIVVMLIHSLWLYTYPLSYHSFTLTQVYPLSFLPVFPSFFLPSFLSASEYGIDKQFNPTKLFIDVCCMLGLASECKRATGECVCVCVCMCICVCVCLYVCMCVFVCLWV